MRIKGNAIIDFYFDTSKEIEVLKCFLSKDEYILFPYKESWFSSVEDFGQISNVIKEFVLERTVSISREHILYWLPDDREDTYWYAPGDEAELLKLISENSDDYVCIIIEKEKDIKDYKYLLSIEENYPVTEEEDCRALLVKEGTNGSYKDEVIPIIQEKFNVN